MAMPSWAKLVDQLYFESRLDVWLATMSLSVGEPPSKRQNILQLFDFPAFNMIDMDGKRLTNN